MGLFRNREVRRLGALALGLCLLFTILGFCINLPAGLLILIFSIFLLGLWLWDLRRRYCDLEKLAAEIDQILHDGAPRSLSQYREGELSILESEINKLLVKLREQNDQLQKDKTYLADAMADISHQLRTGLTTVHLTLTAMGAEALPPGEQGARRREIRRQLERMDWLVSSLLKLSKLDAGTIPFHPVSCPLGTLVDRAAEPLRIPMELKGQVLQSFANGAVFCDPAWTAEAVGNILKNCSEHMGQGTIFVTAEENTLFSQIAIRDTGDGIDPDDLPHLFQRFYRGKNAGKDSVGIGLALSRAILAAQNGTVKARNHPQGGAEFIIRFYKGTV